ncbi:MAG: nucleotidyltransferase family protein, partial [Candidatus Thiodiazotropha sp.]
MLVQNSSSSTVESRTQQITGVLLAAGSGRRFGSAKLMHPLADGEPLGIASARVLISVVPQVVAIVRPGDSELAQAFCELGYRVIENHRYHAGMGESLGLAVRASVHAGGWLVALADMPWISAVTIELLVERMGQGASMIAPTYAGRRGHPVGFAA